MPFDPIELKKLEEDAMTRGIYDYRVFVVGGGFPYLKMFHDAGLKGARSVEDASIICFTGGEDVDPDLYGEEKLPETYCNRMRDNYEAGIYGEAVGMRKPMIGICRGSQFLNVMNGGKLWQHVNNHAIRDGHSVMDLKTGEVRENMTSTHHQMMIPAADAEIIALASEATSKKGHGGLVIRDKAELDDVEVVWYPGSLSLCFQPHPEFQHGECRSYFLDLLDEYILPAC